MELVQRLSSLDGVLNKLQDGEITTATLLVLEVNLKYEHKTTAAKEYYNIHTIYLHPICKKIN